MFPFLSSLSRGSSSRHAAVRSLLKSSECLSSNKCFRAGRCQTTATTTTSSSSLLHSGKTRNGGFPCVRVAPKHSSARRARKSDVDKEKKPHSWGHEEGSFGVGRKKSSHHRDTLARELRKYRHAEEGKAKHHHGRVSASVPSEPSSSSKKKKKRRRARELPPFIYTTEATNGRPVVMQSQLSTEKFSGLVEWSKNHTFNTFARLKHTLRLDVEKTHWAEGPLHEQLFYSSNRISIPPDVVACLSDAQILPPHSSYVTRDAAGCMELLSTGAARSKKEAEYLVAIDSLLHFQELGLNVEKPPNIDAMIKAREKERYQERIQEAQMLLEMCQTSRPQFSIEEIGAGTSVRRRGNLRFVATVTFKCRNVVVTAEGLPAGSKAEAQGNATLEAAHNHLPLIVGKDWIEKCHSLVKCSPSGHVTSLRVPRLSRDSLFALEDALGDDEEDAVRSLSLKEARMVFLEKISARKSRHSSSPGDTRNSSLDHSGRIDQKMFDNEMRRIQQAENNPDSEIGKVKAVRDALPIKAIRESVIHSLETEPVVVVSGGTGSGKSTQIPQYILEDAISHGRGSSTRIVVTQPRRIAAISVAERIAFERGERVGESVGYSVRFKRQPPRNIGGSIEFVTTGTLLRRMINDSTLGDVSHVVIDEVHERDIDTDFLLVLLRNLVDKRPDLRVVLMSATLNAESFAAYFSRRREIAENAVPTMSVPAKPRHPVEIIHLEDLAGESMERSVSDEWPSELRRLSESLLECHDRQLQRELIEADVEEDAAQKLQSRARSEDDGGISLESDSDSDSENENGASGLIGDSRINLLRRAVEARSLAIGGDISLDSSISARDDHREISEVTVALAAKLAQHLARTEIQNGRKGSILCFLPGWDEIKEALAILEESSEPSLMQKMSLLPLHSTIPQDDQQRVFKPAEDGTVKVILATNIAESSVTIDDVLVVIDGGLVRELNYDPESVMSTMETVPISRASATQRLGRAGRVAPGKCYRLYSRGALEAMHERPTPEIQRTALEATCLQTCSMTSAGVSDFLQNAMDPPKEESVKHAMDRLVALGAIAVDRQTENLSPLGHILSQLPLDPATGRMLVMACVMKCLDPLLTAVASFSSRDVFYTPLELREEQRERRKSLCYTSDLMSSLKAYNRFQDLVQEDGWETAKEWAAEHFVSISAMNSIRSIRSQLISELLRIGLISNDDVTGRRRNPVLLENAEVNKNANSEYLQVALLACGLPDSLASRRRLGHFGTLRTRTENHVGLHPSSVLFHRKPPEDRTQRLPSWFLYREMIQSSQVFLRGCTAIEPEQIALFGGYALDCVDGPDGMASAARPLRVLDDWIVLDGACDKSLDTMVRLRSDIQRALELKVMEPRSPLPDSSQKVLDAVCDFYRTLGGELEDLSVQEDDSERFGSPDDEDDDWSEFYARSEVGTDDSAISRNTTRIRERQRELLRDFLGTG